jgi:hydroxyacylglutathione hydrolase
MLHGQTLFGSFIVHPMSGLEDHAGDIFRKSRVGLRVAAEELIEMLGWNQADLEHFEQEGSTPSTESTNWNAVCERLELNPKKFQSILRGWEPEPVRHPWVTQIQTDGGGMAVHAYLVQDPNSTQTAIVDTGWSADALMQEICKRGLEVGQIWITHGHRDHIAALPELIQALPQAQVFAGNGLIPQARRIESSQWLKLGLLSVQVHATPGHAEDGLTFIVNYSQHSLPGVAFVGDAIFAGSMGGAPRQFQLARRKVREVVLTQPDDTLIAPGHGPMTQVAWEAAHNPFF